MTDYKEVTEYLIQWNTDGSVKKLPTLGDAYMYISVSAYARFPKEMVAKMLNTKVLPVKSDPREKDSDGDGYLDGPKDINKDGKINDPRPLKSDVITYKLSKSDFVPITNSNGVKYYGGSQGWMNDNKLVKNPDPVLNEGGCGIAAATDVLTYYERTKSRISKLPKLPNVHKIGISEYAERMVYMGMNHMKPIRIPEALVAASTVLHGMSEIGNVYSIPIAAPPYRVLPGTLGIWPIGSNSYRSQFNKISSSIKAQQKTIAPLSILTAPNVTIANMRFEKPKSLSKIIRSIKEDKPVTLLYGFSAQLTLYEHGTYKGNKVGSHS